MVSGGKGFRAVEWGVIVAQKPSHPRRLISHDDTGCIGIIRLSNKIQTASRASSRAKFKLPAELHSILTVPTH